MSSLDFKEEFIRYVISDEALENKCINSNKYESVVKEIKERIV